VRTVSRAAPSAEEIQALLDFLPAFEQPGRAFSEPSGEGSAASGPVYLGDVRRFFRAAGGGWWDDPDYQPNLAATMLASDEALGNATLAEVRSMLTYCVRGERFCEGHWEALLRSGSIVRLLKRLEVLGRGVR
jgi:hypothetical protein